MTDEPELTGPLRAFQSYFTGPEHRTRRLRMIFLVLFVGMIQAFVFTMLWMTYHSNLIAEEEG